MFKSLRENVLEAFQYIREKLDGNKRDFPVIYYIISWFFANYHKYGYSGIMRKSFTQEKLENLIEKINTETNI